MATTPTEMPADITIDLTEPMIPMTGHRLAELVQALTGCSAERAELAVGDPMPTAAADPDDALTTMALAMVRLRSRQPA
ncbi:MAG TPA: hypothetical protein VFV32_04625 [Acidimicrobiales bacterium]|nr:hypothetical protein [Acidimicrobiales bacterium]